MYLPAVDGLSYAVCVIPEAPTPPPRRADPLPTAGWYANGPGLERWWTGSEWGQQVRAVGQVAVVRRAVTNQPIRTSHTFHLLMTVFTCGLWLPVWGCMAILNRLGRRRVVTTYR